MGTAVRAGEGGLAWLPAGSLRTPSPGWRYHHRKKGTPWSLGRESGVAILQLKFAPANSYDLKSEYGRSAFDVRHTFSAGGTFEVPFGLRLSPLIFASSGRPFNITTGVDSNGDAFFTDRPALTTDLTTPSVRITPFGAFDTEPLHSHSIISRNYGTAPGYFVINLNLTRTFSFGNRAQTAATAQGRQTGVGGNRGTNEARYRLVFGMRAVNLLNRVNLDLPVGNLSSPLFGQSVATAGGFGAASIGNPASGNRRLEMQVRFQF